MCRLYTDLVKQGGRLPVMTIIIVIIISLITGIVWSCIRVASRADDDNKLVTFKCEQCVYKQKCINAGCNINDCRQGLQE